MTKDTEIKGTRLLRKMIAGFDASPDAEGVWTFEKGQSDWRIITNGANQMAVWRGYYDLAGYTAEDLTAMVAVPGWQECDEWFMVATVPSIGARPVIKTWDILSKVKLPDGIFDTDTFLNNGVPCGWSAPGMIGGSNFNLEEIFAGRFRIFSVNQTIGNTLVQTNEQAWGAGDATAGSRIYITRMVMLEDTQVYPDGRICAPPMAVILPVALIHEKDLPYIQRLRRSYALSDERSSV